MNTFYTIWKINKGATDAELLEEEGTFKTRHRAFKRAKKLASKLVYDWGEKILVRKITLGNEDCLQWEFPAIPY